MKFLAIEIALFAIFNSRASAVNSDVAWGTNGQNIPGYTEITGHFLKNHAEYFDNHYAKHGFVGKATHSPADCAVVLADGKALKFENNYWFRLARKTGCTFNWGNGKHCKNFSASSVRRPADHPQIVNYPALITDGLDNRNCQNRSAMSAKKIFQKIKFVNDFDHSDAHSIFVKNTVMTRLAMVGV